MDLMKLWQTFRAGVKGGHCTLAIDEFDQRLGRPQVSLEWRVRVGPSGEQWGFRYAPHPSEMYAPAEELGSMIASRAMFAFQRAHPTVREPNPVGYSDH